MNIIQKIRSWFFGNEEIQQVVEVVETKVVEAIEEKVETVKEEVKELIKSQETPVSKPKPKRKYNRKKKSTGESK